ncbi:hypothetical protein CPAR01_07200 [Colletotrichum paranaense]|uniref:Uncharacterized protein n=1 Tax=Colletotrichum paranaense TaxID=1914294 RepID=A0ABQ9SNX0_9PEZI|nr:uncharacterized protein CPAR01_07200 [Colletotrichum paranaense]KAK1541211.1 hypothetical protein CPAR01_07200 [Colletotrichum paranaense]
MSLVSLPSCQSAFVKKTLTTLLHLRRQVNVSKRNLFALRKSTACLHDEHSSADRSNVSSFCPFAANRHCDRAWVPSRPLSWRVNPSRQGTKISVNQPIFSSQLGLHDGHRPRIARGFAVVPILQLRDQDPLEDEPAPSISRSPIPLHNRPIMSNLALRLKRAAILQIISASHLSVSLETTSPAVSAVYSVLARPRRPPTARTIPSSVPSRRQDLLSFNLCALRRLYLPAVALSVPKSAGG